MQTFHSQRVYCFFDRNQGEDCVGWLVACFQNTPIPPRKKMAQPGRGGGVRGFIMILWPNLQGQFGPGPESERDKTNYLGSSSTLHLEYCN